MYSVSLIFTWKYNVYNYFSRALCVLPKPTPDGCRVIFVQAKLLEPELFVLSDFIKTLSMTIDMLLMTSGTFTGLIIVYDMKGFSISHVGRLGISMMKKYVYFLQVRLIDEYIQNYSILNGII